VLVLGLGIGTATGMLTVYRVTILQTLPIPEPDRVLALWPLGEGGIELPLDATAYGAWRDGGLTVDAVAGFAHWGAQVGAMAEGEQPLPVREAEVTDNFFAVLGGRPVLGRFFQTGDQADGGHVVVISHDLWQRRFDGDPAIIGRTLREFSRRRDFTIVGVAPAGLDYPVGVEVWLPIWPEAPVDMIARMKPGASVASVRSELLGVIDRYRERTGDRRMVDTFVEPLSTVVSGDARPALLAMTAAAALLLLITCSNVGNVLLLRSVGRAREIAVRARSAPRSTLSSARS
jgi:hypothetical protein